MGFLSLFPDRSSYPDVKRVGFAISSRLPAQLMRGTQKKSPGAYGNQLT